MGSVAGRLRWRIKSLKAAQLSSALGSPKKIGYISRMFGLAFPMGDLDE